QLKPIVCHELLHVRRGDTTFAAVQFIAQVVWWFHPLMWLASRESNRVCEQCCDEEVIANIECRPAFYARCLLDTLELTESLPPAPAFPAIRSADITTHRMENIMKSACRCRRGASVLHWAAAVVLAFILLPGGALLMPYWGDSAATAAPLDDLAVLGREATQAVAAKKWALAAEKFREITKLNEQDGRAWFMLGYCLHAEGRLDEAIVIHRRATKFVAVKATALYNLACAYALQGKEQQALDALAEAIDSGFIAEKSIALDADFKSLRGDKKFQALVDQAKRAQSHFAHRASIEYSSVLRAQTTTMVRRVGWLQTLHLKAERSRIKIAAFLRFLCAQNGTAPPAQRLLERLRCCVC
ncbi:MAG: M56 family metallopeptidase, partial [Pirellulaceae bacterium]|nr:M56 family metallopeptidase [Pirellulaceae bacterium]